MDIKSRMNAIEGRANNSSEELNEESISKAEWIIIQMDKLSIKSLGKLTLTTYDTSVASIDCLFLNREDLTANMGNDIYYAYGDYNYGIQRPSRETVLEFLDYFPEALTHLENTIKAPESCPIPSQQELEDSADGI